MEINDTLQLTAVPVPDGVKLVADDPEEITIATLSPPRVEEEPEPDVEEETELVGEEGEAAARRGGRRGVRRGRLGRRLRRGVSPVALPPPRLGSRRANPDRRPWQPRARATPAPGTTSASRSAPSSQRRWDLPRAKKKFGGEIAEGRAGPGGPRVAILLPQTFMNDSGSSAGPARGSLKVPLDRVVVLHDEIDLPFGEVQSRLGGGIGRPQRPQEPQGWLREP